MDISKSRAQQLREIEKAVRLARHNTHQTDPVQRAVAMLVAGPSGAWAVVAALSAYISAEWALPYLVGKSRWWLSLAFAAAGYALIRARAPHKTYGSLICDLLHQYTPTDVEAYKALQAQVAAHGFELETVEVWLGREWDAILTPQKLPEAQLRFVNKHIGLDMAGKDQ